MSPRAPRSRGAARLSLTPDAIRMVLEEIHPITPEAAERLAAWSRTLTQWSRAQRLVGWRAGAELLDRGLADCWCDVGLLDRADLAERPIVDVGSGSGLPGLVLAAAFPTRAVHLVEARRKRAAFLREAARAMELPEVVVHHGRSEVVRGTLSLEAPVFVSRAFAAPPDALAEASRWGASAAVIATSESLLAQQPQWPPQGWRETNGNSRRIRSGSQHDLLIPAA